MNSKSKTKTIFTASGSMVPPLRGWGKLWLGIALTVAVFILLVKLGLWQWARGEEKQLLESRLADYQQMAPVSLKQALATYAPEQITGVRVKVIFEPDTTRTFLLDNQTMDGQVGYLAYQLGRTVDGDWLLVELGFVAAGLQRSMLPQVEWLHQVQSLTGRLYTRSSNPLSSKLLIEADTPHRIQNLNLTELSRWLGEPVVAAVLQPQQSAWPYAQPWQPLAMSSHKHFGYALQWFTMAAVLAMISLMLLKKYRRRARDMRLSSADKTKQSPDAKHQTKQPNSQ
ncbi:SURF1 family protein [Vibrio sp. ABG19]|nr:SURF1 family protein [Vibrio sp. ABG19]